MSHERRQGQWFWRRLMIITLTVFSMTMLTWLAWNGVQSGALHLLIAEGCLWLLFGLALLYVAGATTQDIIALATAVRGGFVATARASTITTETTQVTKSPAKSEDGRMGQV